MHIKTLCKECNKYQCFLADDGTILSERCYLDLPIFNTKKPIICNSYIKRKE